jgi:hypothetical protein
VKGKLGRRFLNALRAGPSLNGRRGNPAGSCSKKGEPPIVELMKVLDLDSSFTARKELAKELNYTGALDGSARNEYLAA